MTATVPVRIGNWGRHASRAIELLRRGHIVELIEDDEVVGYIVPPRLPITAPIIELSVGGASPDDAAALRKMLEDMAASGRWSYEPHTGRYVTDPRVPPFPRAEGEEP